MMAVSKRFIYWFIILNVFNFSWCYGLSIEFIRLKNAYPERIKEITASYILWQDGMRMPIRWHLPGITQLLSSYYHTNNSLGSISREDVIKDRYEPFFRKMYGQSAQQVNQHLTTIYWMPHVFGFRFPLKVTTINGVDKKLQRISNELEKLPSEYHKYLVNPAGAFYWRKVAGESYLSMHSFGIAIDINSHLGNYWLWDIKRGSASPRKLMLHNNIPMKIVEIFEKEKFFWGGHWYFYDTMHFEYRPEFFI
jgi:peptidoglycan LD-endopeptidase CwlK